MFGVQRLLFNEEQCSYASIPPSGGGDGRQIWKEGTSPLVRLKVSAKSLHPRAGWRHPMGKEIALEGLAPSAILTSTDLLNALGSLGRRRC
jgi:hypothetical protein